MKFIFASLACSILSISTNAQNCGDGRTYALLNQTENHKRFDLYPKIDEKHGPQFKGGDRKFEKILRKNLIVSDIAKNQIFNLDYQFTVSCDSHISDIIISNDMRNWTNIVDIISSTVGWSPAIVNGVNVDCIYFGSIYINGSNY